MACKYLLLTSFVVGLTFVRAEIVLKDNGYEDVVVAIHNSIKEDLTILSNLKGLFLSASKFLFHATDQRAFFRSVTIALPAHWSDQDDYITSTGNHFPGAHIRVDAPNPEYGDEPYTLQPGACGEPGRYIHLTTDYVLSLKKTQTDDKSGKRLIHEWAHLRYGVFDENGYLNDPKYPVFYRDGAQIFTNACVRNIRGTMVKLEGGPCDITEGNDIDLKNCTFIPFDDNEVKASLMFKPYVPSIFKFCDEYSHNAVAPNKHNEMCNSESVWTVVKRHADFQSNLPTTLQEEELKTQFRVVKAKKDDRGRYVLVLDVSGSMVGKPIHLLHNAASRLISDVVKEGSFMGLVSFRDRPFTLSPLVQITDQTRVDLVTKLPRDTGGKTAIGEGLLRGLEVLSASGNVTDGAVIVLLTDGEENVAPFIKKVIPQIQKKKVIVHCIAFGSAASDKLENLALATGGKSFLVQDVSGNKPIMVLDSAFRESVLATLGEEEQPVVVVQDDLDLFSTRTELGIDLDPQLGLNTVFSLDVTGQDAHSVNMTILSPNGNIYGPASGNEIYSAERDHIKVFIHNETEPGSYKVQLTKRDRDDVKASIEVTSEPRDPDDPPIRVRSWLSDIQVKYPGRIRVFAEVKRGYDPVIGASVTATVRQDSSLQEVILHDNGVGPDVTKDDGIYSAFISHFEGNGRYGVISKVTNVGDARMKFSPKISNRKVRSVDDHEGAGGKRTTAGSNAFLPPFQRTAEAGTFLVHNWTSDVPNIYPPDKVRDLEVIDKKVLSGDYKLVTLSWVFPDENIDETRVILVDLRASCRRENIVKNFTQTFAFSDTLVVNGSLRVSPQDKQIITVKVPADIVKDSNCTLDSVESYYFALRLLDDSTASDTSVITAAHFPRTPIYKKDEDNLTYWFLGGGICTFLLLLIIIFIFMRRTKKVEPEDLTWSKSEEFSGV